MGGKGWMDAGVEQGFAGVDVAQSGDYGLIKQPDLDRLAGCS
jgi:hypothetical protein